MKCAPSSMQRNAEPLPHVQHHTVFKGFLAGFYKLHKEAEGEYGSEAVAEIETGYSVVFVLFIQPQAYDKNQKIGDGFLKLCRVAGLHIFVRK